MTNSIADFLISRLTEWNIWRIDGYAGDGINGIIGAIGRAGEQVDYVQVRHEEMSAFTACGILSSPGK
jgi:pyruvate dehydrogenase (quinone)